MVGCDVHDLPEGDDITRVLGLRLSDEHGVHDAGDGKYYAPENEQKAHRIRGDDDSTYDGAEYDADVPRYPEGAVCSWPVRRRNDIGYHRVRGWHVEVSHERVRDSDDEQCLEAVDEEVQQH